MSQTDTPEVIQGRLGWESGDLSEANPRELEPHPKNEEIYGDTEDPNQLGEQFLESVREKGVLEPLIITEGKTVISGHRRRLAAVETGRERVPVLYFDFEDGLAEREALIELNRQRQKTPGQLLNEFEELVAIERERARERNSKTAGFDPSPETFPETEKGDARDKAAEKLDAGVSGRTLEKGLKVKEKAESDDTPNEVRETAQRELDKLNQGETTFHGALEQVQKVESRQKSRRRDSAVQKKSAEELASTYSVETGQIWEIQSQTSAGRHRLVCGDGTDQSVLSQLLDGEVPQLAFVDPPYGVSEDTNRGEKKRGNLTASYDFDAVIGDDSVATAIEAHRVLSGLGIPYLVFWGANNYASELPESSGWIVWDKRDGVKSDDNSDFELAWTNQDRAARMFRHLWKGAVKGSENQERRVHPTQKPVALAEWCISDWVKSDVDRVLDPFVGSGSTLLAADESGCLGYGAELSPEYIAVTLSRFENNGNEVSQVGVVE